MLHGFFTRARDVLLRATLWAGIGLGLALGLLGASLRVWPLPPWPPLTREVRAADGSLLSAQLASDGQWRLHTPPEAVNPVLIQALLAKEDRWFYWHPGLNPLAVLRAVGQNLGAGRRVSGASTLTMQLARLLEPGERSLLKKLLEACRALQLEWRYSKRELLTQYLTLAPCGGNVQGFGAASWRYFNRPADALSVAQCVSLVLLPGRPTALRPGRGNAALLAARNSWLQRLTLGQQQTGILSAIDAAAAQLEPLGFGYFPLPRLSPHLSRRLLLERPETSVTSTLQPTLQRKAEVTLAAYLGRLRNYQVTNGAALIVHTRSRRVLAYVGSASFDDAAALGQVDGVQAVRSPGSALKPMIYALAMDQGLVTPRSVLLDVPTRFGGGYEPENYDQGFSGQVTVRAALERSLNVPAVRLLEQVGTQRVVSVLSRAGCSSIAREADRLGLSVALGGCGVRLSELVGLYAALADGGRWRPLVFGSEQEGTDTLMHPLVSPAAAWMTAEILTTLTRPDLPNNLDNAVRLPRLAWKTGTSYGRRDAWAVGFTAEYTVGVWVGNFDGRGSAVLSGAEVATPLLFQLVQALPGVDRARWLPRPQALLPRTVCAQTGALPDTFCHDLVLDDYIQGRAPAQRCTHLLPHWVSPDARLRYTPSCAPPEARRQLYPNPPAELVAWWRQQPGRADAESGLPPLAPQCVGVESSGAPTFILPNDAGVYYFGRAQARRLVLRARAAPDVRRLFWFAQDKYLGATAADSSYVYVADTGRIRLSVSDDRGRSTRIAVRVTVY